MISKRQLRLAATKELKKAVTKFEPIDLSVAPYVPPGMTRAFRNTRYTVMIYDNIKTTAGLTTKALIQKHGDVPIDNHWSEIQKIKNEIFGEEVLGIEYYPPQSELINTHNIYWLWIYPEGVIPKQIL